MTTNEPRKLRHKPTGRIYVVIRDIPNVDGIEVGRLGDTGTRAWVSAEEIISGRDWEPVP